MIALLCPGQGAQAPGMLSAWLQVDGLAALLGSYVEASGIDLLTLGTTADAETIKDTAVAQPLIVATSLLSLAALTARAGSHRHWAGAVAGHSVGEFAAAAVAGVLTATDALRLVAVRGRAMAEAAARTPTGMSAVLGGDAAEVARMLAELNLVGANVNGGGQVIAAGTLEDLQRLRGTPPARARVMPLQVAGAFHTSHMSSAVDVVAGAAAAISPADPELVLLSNADGAPVADGAAALTGLVRQISSPVRWDLCQEQLLSTGVTAVIELVPGGVLTGLARRTLPGVEAVALKSPADLEAAIDLISRHTATESEDTR